MSTSELSGSWTYRSFNPAFVTGNQTPQEDSLILADGVVLTLRTAADPTALEGTIDWEGGGLDLNGTVLRGVGDEPVGFDIVGTGRPNTPTAGWEYHYHGHQTWYWPDGVFVQRPTLVGSVFRARTHNGNPPRSPAGYVASFIAVKPQQVNRTSPYDLTGSWTYLSFHNNPAYPYLTAPPIEKIFEPKFDDPSVGYHGLILQETVFKLEPTSCGTMRGTIEWPGGVLDIEGEVPAKVPQWFTFRGVGRPGTATDGWDFRYDGHLTRNWRNGVQQRPALVGSFICFKPHDLSPYGFVYPFIAVKQP